MPRLHGFELLMASYAMCHMKLDMQLEQTGYKPSANPPRLSVWLTNALEPAEREVRDLFFAPLAEEARGASEVKRQAPIMCVIGNPPYSGHSSNFGDWIEGLMTDYKVSPELKRPAQAKWLSDDYVKFIRMSEHLIEQNGEGVLGFITNHSYLDNPTFLDMRNHLRETFDRIFVLDLHGNAKKKELSPDGSPDKNVFDIQQGVAIIVAVKRKGGSEAKRLATVLHADLWGSRESKYQALWDNSRASMNAKDVSPDSPPWRFQQTDKRTEHAYSTGVSLAALFGQNGSPAPGIVTTQDEFAISWSSGEAAKKVESLLATRDEAEARKLFRLCSQSQWNYEKAKAGLADGAWRKKVIPIHFRPLDDRFTVFDSHVAVHRRARATTHLVGHENLALAVPRQKRDEVGGLVLRYPSTHKIFAAYDINFILPLYLYPEHGTLDQTIRLNLDPKLYAAICAAAGIDPAEQAGPDDDFRAATGDARPSEVKVFDYIYGVLHSPAYRETFAEFLKIDFPRIPYPKSPDVFRHVSEKGEALRRLHLMEAAAIGEAPYRYDGEGEDVVASGFPKWEKSGTPDQVRGDGGGAPVSGRVFINADQYFENVPGIAWNFHIGGYQPAQKWLKDRRGRALSFDDIGHYQKIVKILIETDRIMKEIDLPLE